MPYRQGRAGGRGRSRQDRGGEGGALMDGRMFLSLIGLAGFSPPAVKALAESGKDSWTEALPPSAINDVMRRHMQWTAEEVSRFDQSRPEFELLRGSSRV